MKISKAISLLDLSYQMIMELTLRQIYQARGVQHVAGVLEVIIPLFLFPTF